MRFVLSYIVNGVSRSITVHGVLWRKTTIIIIIVAIAVIDFWNKSYDISEKTENNWPTERCHGHATLCSWR